jgi:CRP/FNR family transcriptional regulator
MEPLDALARSGIFRDVPKEDLARLSTLAEPRRFQDRDVIVREDEEAREIFVIVSGRAEVELRWPMAQGEESQQIGTLREGDAIGEVALVDRCLRSATVRAVGNVTALAIPNEGLRRLMDATPALGYRVMSAIARLLAGRMRDTNLKLRNTIANLIY